MSDNLVKSLNSALAAPASLEQQRTGKGFFLDEKTTPIPSEANMLTILTMKDLFKDKVATLDKVAKEESKYLMRAMEILTGDPAQPQIKRVQDKFGKDVAGAAQLAQLLKTEAINQEYQEQVSELLQGFKKPSGAGAFA